MGQAGAGLYITDEEKRWRNLVARFMRQGRSLAEARRMANKKVYDVDSTSKPDQLATKLVPDTYGAKQSDPESKPQQADQAAGEGQGSTSGSAKQQRTPIQIAYTKAYKKLRDSEKFRKASQKQQRWMLGQEMLKNPGVKGQDKMRVARWVKGRRQRPPKTGPDDVSLQEAEQQARQVYREKEDIEPGSADKQRQKHLEDWRKKKRDLQKEITEVQARAAEGAISPRGARIRLQGLQRQMQQAREDAKRKVREAESRPKGNVEGGIDVSYNQDTGQGMAGYTDPATGERVYVKGKYDSEQELREKARQQYKKRLIEYKRKHSQSQPGTYKMNHGNLYRPGQPAKGKGKEKKNEGGQSDSQGARNAWDPQNRTGSRPKMTEHMLKRRKAWLKQRAKGGDQQAQQWMKKWKSGNLSDKEWREMSTEIGDRKLQRWSTEGASLQHLRRSDRARQQRSKFDPQDKSKSSTGTYKSTYGATDYLLDAGKGFATGNDWGDWALMAGSSNPVFSTPITAYRGASGAVDMVSDWF